MLPCGFLHGTRDDQQVYNVMDHQPSALTVGHTSMSDKCGRMVEVGCVCGCVRVKVAFSSMPMLAHDLFELRTSLILSQ